MKSFVFPLVLLVIGLVIILPLAINQIFLPLELNQFALEEISGKYSPLDFKMQKNNFVSSYASGLNIIINNPKKNPPELANQEEFVDYLFSWFPSYIHVYPTEGFYYYSLEHPTEKFAAGNIRLADIDIKKYSVAFFPINEDGSQPEDIYILEGSDIKTEKLSESLYKVTRKDRTIYVRLPFVDAQVRPRNLELLQEEKFIGRIQDESGIRLLLIFNNFTNSFYMLVNEEYPLADRLDEINDSLYIGKRTGFLFYRDTSLNRTIFIGAYSPNVEENNFLDGPGDQVPFKIDIKEELERAYPHTLIGNGTDNYGVYLNRTGWVRIAITPFEKYKYASDVQAKIKSCMPNNNPSIFYTCVTKEWWNTPFWKNAIIDLVEKEHVYKWPRPN